MISTAFLLHWMPLEFRYVNMLEIYNDLTFIGVCYSFLCFTDLVVEAEGQYYIGFVFISLSVALLVVHLTIIVFFSIKKVKLNVLKCLNKRKQRKDL